VNLRLSPDQTRVAMARTINDNTDIWIYEIASRRWSRLTSNPGVESSPVWSPDGRNVAYAADRDRSNQIYRTDANGAGQEQRLTDGPNAKIPGDWSKDGRHLIYTESHPENQRDLWVLPLERADGAPGKPFPFLTTTDGEFDARFSPDGKWIAFISNTTGGFRVYIRAFPGGPPGQWPVSSGNATDLAWTKNGKELLYHSPNPGGGGLIFAAPVQFLPDRPEIGAAQELFRPSLPGTSGTASSDGQRFLLFTRPGDDGEGMNPLTVVINWHAALE
jgi:Tol biopolymer transport system component